MAAGTFGAPCGDTSIRTRMFPPALRPPERHRRKIQAREKAAGLARSLPWSLPRASAAFFFARRAGADAPGFRRCPQHTSRPAAPEALSADAAMKPSLAARAMMLPIRFYRAFISPLTPPQCRFTPTCSTYALEAFRIHGIIRGAALSAWRILRCQPLCKGGHDPVPPPSPARLASALRKAAVARGKTIRQASPRPTPHRAPPPHHRHGRDRPSDRSPRCP
jgi:putative membrane protein insertion efficiency factor